MAKENEKQRGARADESSILRSIIFQLKKLPNTKARMRVIRYLGECLADEAIVEAGLPPEGHHALESREPGVLIDSWKPPTGTPAAVTTAAELSRRPREGAGSPEIGHAIAQRSEVPHSTVRHRDGSEKTLG